jgi:hypothetical protein
MFMWVARVTLSGVGRLRGCGRDDRAIHLDCHATSEEVDR